MKLFIYCVFLVCLLFPGVSGCGWVYPETSDPKAARELEEDAMRPLSPPEADSLNERHPGARSQPLPPAAKQLAHDVRIRLENRSLGFPGSPEFDVVEVYISALDEEEYIAAKERYAVPEQAFALFMPDTEENRDRYYRQAMGSAVTLRFQPTGTSTQVLSKKDPFWIVAADRHAVGLLLVACLPGGRSVTRMLSLEKGAWPGRGIDLLLTSNGWNVLSAQRK